MRAAQPYGYSGIGGTCFWCGRRLKLWISHQPAYGRGYLGDNLFCTLSCGYEFAFHAVQGDPAAVLRAVDKARSRA